MENSPNPPFPKWLKAVTFLIAVTCVGIFVLGYFAHKLGALMNLTFLTVMVGFVVVLLFRLPYFLTGQIHWSFWKAPFGSGHRRQWFHILPRLGFLGMMLLIIKLSFIPAQLSNEQLIPVTIMGIGGFTILAVIWLFPKRVGQWPMTIFSVIAIGLLGLVVAKSLLPLSDSDGVIVVDAPIGGTSLMVQAGNDTLINYHAAHRSQKHAFDIIVPKEDGREYRDDPFEDNPCFSTQLLAPVAGEVVKVESSLPDQLPGGSDRKNPAGNHVVIKMDETHFALLAHMKQDSALVEVGQTVEIGQALGFCGNSGNTTSPHLHFQVQRYADLFAKDGYTYPVKFRNVARIRNGKTEYSAPLDFRRNDLMVEDDPAL